jgi:hypothetical protein
MKKILFLPLLVLCLISVQNIVAQSNDPASVRLNKMTGKWDVTMTMQITPGAKPMVIKGIVAERLMIGDYCINEAMYPGPDAKTAAFRRISDLAYNKNENRWDYISIDTRVTAGIMYFTYKDSNASTINSYITSFPHPGFGQTMQGRGQAVYARNVITKINDMHDIVRQYWRLTDRPEWLAVQYEYVKRR